MGHVVDHVGVVVGIDRADPLVHACALAYVLRRQTQSAKRLIYIRGDGAGLVDSQVAVLEDRNAVEGMQRQVLALAHHGFKVVKAVRHVLVGQD